MTASPTGDTIGEILKRIAVDLLLISNYIDRMMPNGLNKDVPVKEISLFLTMVLVVPMVVIHQ